MADYRKLTILHSNDMHGDFLAETIDDSLVGGVSMLSGYLNKVRNQEPEALYVIAGDMFRGSIIDAEYQGVSTIEIMNYLAPDVVTLGNHEVDYGMTHLLFLEKCCKFPIVNANLYIKTTGTRIFNSHKVLRAAGMNILFFGITQEETRANGEPRVLASSDYSILEEYLMLHTHLQRSVEGRLKVLNGPNNYPDDI